MRCRPSPIALAVLPLAIGLAVANGAAAQRAGENAVASADDAFGSQVGNEKTGIYSDTDVRGFNPIKAGNLRVEGIYFDQQAAITSRIRAGSRIRVGVAALDYPFPAPSGIVDHQLRGSGDVHVVSAAADRTQYGGTILELDTQVPVIKGRLSFTTGVAFSHNEEADGSSLNNYATGISPHWRFEGGELTPFVAYVRTRESKSRVVIAAPGAFVPYVPPPRVYLGQTWADASSEGVNFGFVSRFDLPGAWALRAGLFQSRQLKHHSYSEVFVVEDEAGNSRHRIFADPRQNARSVSGEGQLAWRRDGARLSHRLLFMVRGRDKLAETGGADVRDLGPVRLGERDRELEPTFAYGPVDRTTIRQVTGGVGYVGRLTSVARLNLGLQKSDYKASFRRQAIVAVTRDRPWLYNATFVLTPSPRVTAYAQYVTGLEESGLAPENAANRNEVLPAAKTEQFDGGVRLRLGQARLVASAFQISKPNFSFDLANAFVPLGDVRHRGIEASLAGKVAGRLDLVAGAVLMDPVVTGEARRLGRVGKRPVGVPTTLLRLDAEYATPVKGLSLTTSAIHTGARTVSTRGYAELGGRQLKTEAFTTLDLGARYRFHIQEASLSARLLLSNVLDERAWKIVASNSYQINDTRRLAFFLVADF